MRLADVMVDPRPVAVARIGLGLATVINSVEIFAVLTAVADGKLARPVVGWAPAPTHAAVLCYLAVATVAGIALIAGLRTQTAAVLTTVLNVGVLLWDEQTYSSHRILATLLVFYLVLARSDQAWSLTVRGRLELRCVPWWPQLLMMTQLSVCYWFAAISKVNPTFLSGDGLRDWVWWPLPDWIFGFIAIATVVTELFLAVGLWVVRTRRLAAVVGLALHVSIVLMLTTPLPLVAFALECLPLCALFLFRPRSFPTDGGQRDAPRTTELTEAGLAAGAA